MSDHQTQLQPDKIRIGWFLTLLICVVIFLSGAGVIVLIFSTEPEATRAAATKKTAMLVEVTKAQKGDFVPQIFAMGTVVPARDIMLRPRVNGKVIECGESFSPGGFVQKGDVLLKIDPDDYKNAVKQRKSELKQAESDLEIEMGRQYVARKDYQAMGRELPKERTALILRRPQMNDVRARVDAAEAALDQAGIELERTEIKAPFDAHVLSRNANEGSMISIGDTLGRLVGLDTYWIEATVPLSRVRRLSFPDSAGGDGAKVRIRNRVAWKEGEYREGRLYKFIGALEEQTRMARLLVSVDDPLARGDRGSDKPALVIGAYVECRIQAKEIPDVVRLNRDYVRKRDTVWVMQEGALDIRDVEIVFRDDRYAYIQSGLQDNEMVVKTNLATVVQGAGLRRKNAGNDPADTNQVQESSRRGLQ